MNPPLAHLLFVMFWLIWVALALKPLDRKTWWLENITLFATLPFVLWAFRTGLLSTLSVVIMFLFAVLHIAAAHYSYAKTPWGTWFKRAFHLRRNHYDRVVHFLYGFLMVPVAADEVRER
jgi:putative membrane protein